jgi:hypothetical protein
VPPDSEARVALGAKNLLYLHSRSLVSFDFLDHWHTFKEIESKSNK